MRNIKDLEDVKTSFQGFTVLRLQRLFLSIAAPNSTCISYGLNYYTILIYAIGY